MAVSVKQEAAEVARSYDLKLGLDGAWRGPCPNCRYEKSSFVMAVQDEGIAVSCVSCGNLPAIAAAMKLPSQGVVPYREQEAKLQVALKMLERSTSAEGTLAEDYLRNRGITIPIPPSIGFRKRLANWVDRKKYRAMVGRVEGWFDNAEIGGAFLPTGIHATYLCPPDQDGVVRRIATEPARLTLGSVRGGGVWLTPTAQLGHELAVAEGIETAASVQQITGLPTVAALGAAGMRSLHWPPSLRRLWIAADNDAVGLGAAKALAARAHKAGLEVTIKIPAGNHNDFNDLLRNPLNV